jgi:hypothetical protein
MFRQQVLLKTLDFVLHKAVLIIILEYYLAAVVPSLVMMTRWIVPSEL